MGHAADRLGQLFPAWPARPVTLVAVAVDRHMDQPRPPRCQGLCGQAQPLHGPAAVALGEDVGLIHEAEQGFAVGDGLEVQEGGALAVAGVRHERRHEGQIRPGNVQDVSPVGGQGPPAGRARQHAGQVEHPDTGERGRRTAREGNRRAVTDPLNLDQRRRGQPATVIAGVPFAWRANHGATDAGLRKGLLEVRRRPAGEGLADGLRSVLAAEHRQDPRAIVEALVQEHPPAVAAGIKGLGRRGDRRAVRGAGRVLEPLEQKADQAGGGLPGVDGDRLVAAGAQGPQPRRLRAPGRQGRRGGLLAEEGRGQGRRAGANRRRRPRSGAGEGGKLGEGGGGWRIGRRHPPI